MLQHGLGEQGVAGGGGVDAVPEQVAGRVGADPAAAVEVEVVAGVAALGDIAEAVTGRVGDDLGEEAGGVEV